MNSGPNHYVGVLTSATVEYGANNLKSRKKKVLLIPLGSLLNGYHSPILVNRTFHDGIFVSLGQSETLDLSQCSHLRKITDDQLITLMRKIVDITKASALDGDNDYHTGMTNIIGGRMNDNCGSGGITCQYSIQLTHINFSNCRRLSGESIHYCLRHTPNLKR